MRKIIGALLALLLLCMCGCRGGGGATISNSVWVTYDGVEDRVRNEQNKDIFVYSYQQPVIGGNASGSHMVNTKLNNSTTAFLYGSGGVEEMTELAKMDWKEPWFTCYALKREVSVARLDDAVASFRYADYVYNGGAHGNTYEHGVTYDMVSGQQMSLANLADDEEALKLVCRQHILAELSSEEYPHREGLMPDYESYLDSVLKNWVLTNDGLQFIAQPYIISTYAAGTLRFTVPYEKLVHVLQERWIPAEHGHGGGTVDVTDVDTESPAATNFVLHEDGENLVIRVNGKIYDFSVEQVNSYQHNGESRFYLVKQQLYSPLVSSESFGLRVRVPEGVPDTMLRWKDGSGKEYQYLLARDGKSGGVRLTEMETYITRY